MATEAFFGVAAQVCGILAGILGLITGVLWVRSSPLRFAFFGYTAFTGVLTAGCFALTLTPIVLPNVAGSASYTTVYDRGANQAVIKVASDIDPDTLKLTLEQAGQRLLSSGRFSTGSQLFTLRARTVIHPQPGLSEPLYLGQLQQPLGSRQQGSRQQGSRQQGSDQTIEIFADAFVRLENSQS